MKIAHIIPPWGRFNYETARAIYEVAYLLIKEQIKNNHLALIQQLFPAT